MTIPFAAGKLAFGFCDICGFRYNLRELKKLVIKTKVTNILACPQCWVPDQPQLMLGAFPVEDPQALENPRPDNSFYEDSSSGAGGSRMIFWGWNPVGGARGVDSGLTIDPLRGISSVGTVTIIAT